MSLSLFARRSLTSRSAVRMNAVIPNQVRLASTGSPLNSGPSKVETQAQGSENRGKTTQMVLPLTAGVLALGAFAWLFTKNDKKDLVPVGVNSSGPDKLKSGSMARAEEQVKKSN